MYLCAHTALRVQARLPAEVCVRSSDVLPPLETTEGGITADLGFISVLTDSLFVLDCAQVGFRTGLIHNTLCPEELLAVTLIQKRLQLQTPLLLADSSPCAHVLLGKAYKANTDMADVGKSGNDEPFLTLV